MGRTFFGGVNSGVSFIFFSIKVAIIVVVFWNHFHVHAFVINNDNRIYNHAFSSITTNQQQFRTITPLGNLLFASSRNNVGSGTGGMGMGSPTTKTKKTSSKNKKKTNAGSKVSSALSNSVKSSTSPFDVSASLLRLEKKYDELMLNAAKELQREMEEDNYEDDDSIWSTSTQTTATATTTTNPEMMTSEYVIAARSSSNTKKTTSSNSISDWVPIAQLCIKRPISEYHHGASDEMVQTAVSLYCRELSQVAVMGAPIFSTIPRNEVQYSVESVDSFHKFVYEQVIDGGGNKSKNQNPDQSMTKSEARKVLGLIKEEVTSMNNGVAEITKTDIKQAYRKLSFELHPDRFEGSTEERKEATQQFGRVKLAYETLSSGVRGEEGTSWYESLGGRARTGFVGPVNLLPIPAAQEHMNRHKAEGAIMGLEPSLIQSFVARQLRSSA